MKAFDGAWCLPCVLLLCSCDSDIKSATLPGHLKPLGSQGPALAVEEMLNFPNGRTFHRYTKESQPFVVKGGCKDSLAYDRWTDEYLRSKEGVNREIVTVEFGKTETEGRRYYTMKEFLKVYKIKDINLVTAVPKYIRQDVSLPYSLSCGGYQTQLVDAVMLFSSGDTKSLLHQDDADSIRCLFAGTNDIYLIEYPKYKDKVVLDHRMSGYSSVDTDSVDLIRYSGLKEVEFYYVQMKAGDCVYIPYKWFHYVRSYDRNIAVNVCWSPLIEFNVSDCNYSYISGDHTIEKYHFQAFHENFHGDKDKMGEQFLRPADMRHYFRDLVQEDKAFTLDELTLKLQNRKEILTKAIYLVRDMSVLVRKMFDILDFDGDNLVTTSDIDRLDQEASDRLLGIVDDLEDLLDDQMVKIGPNDTGDRSVPVDDEIPNYTERDEL